MTPRARSRRPVLQTEVARWRALRAQGWTVARIAREAGRCFVTIYNHVYDLNVDCRRREGDRVRE